MKFENPVLESIYEKAIAPALSRRYQDVEGRVVRVHYTEQKVDVRWRDPNSGGTRISRNVPIPKDADGIYRQSLKVGDQVVIAFKNGSPESPYISVVYRRDQTPYDYYSQYGGGIPKGIGSL